MDERSVVTVFLRNGCEVLLLRRSDVVGSYPGRWGGVAGHAEGDPDEAALREVEEETGIGRDQVSLVRRGDAFDVVDESLEVRWTVTPYLFDTDTRSVSTDWETTESEWVHPTAILSRATVPDLWSSYDSVRPRVSTVGSDMTHGSASISIRALEVLRDEAALLDAEGGTWTDIGEIGSRLIEARPEMAAVVNRVNQVLSAARDEQTPSAVHSAAIAGIEAALRADTEAAEHAATELADTTVFTLSRSGTVRQAIEHGEPASISIARSTPGSEGVRVAGTLAEGGFEVSLTSDANIPGAVRDADLVLVGADTVSRDGDVVNKVGTTAAMLAARQFDVPAYVVCSTAKISSGEGDAPDIEGQDLEEAVAEVASGGQGGAEISIVDPVFEVTPGELIDGFITENGLLDREEVRAIADRHADAAGWSSGDP